ncbi:MAG: bifunctional homocysteine S-methyltransferase/methylenetetrahydrofolate reductase [Myxococcota bacterium]|nr:bifunctional homocysteine S-methyltransferase/methylenetetrahydrofolate reductase [Myxococcota bacterium]
MRAAKGALLFDGAMGTLLYQRGIFTNQCFDQISLTQPNLVKQIHREYLDAGATVICTNTFGANRIKLRAQGHEAQLEEINRVGVQLAREVVRDDCFVAGSVGPTGIGLDSLARPEGAEARAAIREQILILADAGIDFLCLETFTVLQELEFAIESARGLGLPIVATYVFQESGRGAEGQSPAQVAQRLIDAGADVIGTNCGGGAEKLFPLILEMAEVAKASEKLTLVQANAGRPAQIDGRTIYLATPEYFSVFTRRLLTAGVNLIGGCCGTTPAYIKRMAGAIKMRAPRIEGAANARPAKVPLAARSALGSSLAAGRFITSVELNPPPGLDLSKTIEKARRLRDAGVSTINIADGPRASLRVGNLAMAQQVQSETGLSPILHVCCRDRSFLGLQSHLLGAHVLGIRNLVVITGDPPKLGPYPHSSGVYDLDSVELLEVLKGYNHGIDPAGREMKAPTSFLLATGAEPAALDQERELRRLEAKYDAGAELLMTQPVYDPAVIDRFLCDIESMNLPVMLGLCPLASYRNAIFLHTQVPGMHIPKEVLERMERADEQGRGAEEGVRIARETLLAVEGRVQGAYLMPPFGRYQLALDVLEGFIEPTSR